MTQRILVMMMVCAVVIESAAQPFGIGDKIKDVQLDTMVNYAKNTERLAKLNSKPMIVSFWFAACSNCMKTWRTLDSLEKESGDVIQFLGVTTDAVASTRALFKQHRVLQQTKVPVVASNTLLRDWLPHISMPHIVWIDGQGKIVAMTDSKQLTRENIKRFAAGEPMLLPEKRDAKDAATFLVTEPLILHEYANNREQVLEYVYISKYISGVAGIVRTTDHKDGTIRMLRTNASLKELYKTAYECRGFHDNQILMKDAERFEPDYGNKTNLYCFDMKLRGKTLQQGFTKMQKELDGYFEMKSRKVKRKMQCYVLRIADSVRFKEPIQLTAAEPDAATKEGFQKLKLSMSSLRESFLNKLPVPVVDETGHEGWIELMYPADRKDKRLIEACLAEKGLRLELAERELDCIVIE